MNKNVAAIILLSLGFAVGLAGSAQSRQLKPAQVALKYRLNAGDGKPSGCFVTLQSAAAGPGRILDLTEPCRQKFGLQSVTGWRLQNNTIIFVSEGGSPIVAFEENDEVEAGEGHFVFSETNGGMRDLSEWRGK